MTSDPNLRPPAAATQAGMSGSAASRAGSQSPMARTGPPGTGVRWARQPLLRVAGLLILFSVVFVFLTVSSYRQKSATWDEPQHLTSGLMAGRLGDYRVDPEHPPLLRLWAALPLLGRADVRLDASEVDAIDPGRWAKVGQFVFAHQFLYALNDADRLLYAARFMIVLIGILLGVLIFAWGFELFGFGVAAILLGFYALEPNILAHSSLVTTDLGVTFLFFGTIYFLWRVAREINAWNLAGLVVFFALAHVSKFSALLLGPLVLLLAASRVMRPEPWRCAFGGGVGLETRGRKALAAGGVLLLLFLVAWGAIWAAYGFRYSPSSSAGWLFRFSDDPAVRSRVPGWSGLVGWIDGLRLLPNAYSQGFLLGQSSAHTRGAYLAGHYSQTGWWIYFPVAFLLKTPLALLLLAAGGLALSIRRRRILEWSSACLILPAALYMAVAMTARLNIGLRHILPIYPFAIMLAGSVVGALSKGKGRIVLAGLCAVWVLELALVIPDHLAFFNLATGGARNGDRYLVDSNLDWGQDLKGLKRWMDRNGVRHVNLSYFGTADPAYYGIDCTYLPGSPFFAQGKIGAPRMPGYVAVSATNLHGPHLGESGAALFRPLLAIRPVAVIGHSIHVYRLEK